MRLLQVMAGAPHGGAETFFARLVPALQREGIVQHVVMRGDAGRAAALANVGIGCTTARFGGPLDLISISRLARAIETFRPEIVLSWMNRATRAVVRARHGRPFVHVGTPRGYYAAKYYRGCEHLVVTTRDIADFYLRQDWPAARVHVIPNFVPDLSAQAAAAVPRASLDTPDGVPLLLALGRLHVNKAFDVLLTAMSRLPDCWLWIAGSGPLDGALKEQAAALGVAHRVRFLGWRQDVPALLAAADVFVCSSRHEPFGNIVAEAWASGTPVVAAASEGPGMLIEDGSSGLLVPVDDADALAAAVSSIVGDRERAATIAAQGRQTFLDGYSEAVIIKRYRELLQSLVATGPAS